MCQPASICCSLFVFKLYHKTCEQFYRNFGLYEKSPNSFLPGLPRSIINQFRFHNLLCLCLASVHLPHPFHLIIGFQLLGHAVSLRQLRHDQLHAVSCRFVNLSAILSYIHPAMPEGARFLGDQPNWAVSSAACPFRKGASSRRISSAPPGQSLSMFSGISGSCRLIRSRNQPFTAGTEYRRPS